MNHRKGTDMRTISTFWIGYCLGLLCLSDAWRDRDAPELHPAEHLTMDQWLHLPEHERSAVVAQYAKRKPPIPRYLDTNERRQPRPA